MIGFLEGSIGIPEKFPSHLGEKRRIRMLTAGIQRRPKNLPLALSCTTRRVRERLSKLANNPLEHILTLLFLDIKLLTKFP